MSKAYNIWFTEEEKQLYKKIAAKHGYNTLSKLIRRSLEVVARKPALLEPTEDETLLDNAALLELFEKSFTKLDPIVELMNEFHEFKTKQEQYNEFIATKLGASKQELKKLHKKDTSAEVIFDE